MARASTPIPPAFHAAHAAHAELTALFGYAPDSGGSYRWLARLQAAGLTPRHPGSRRHWRVTAEELIS